MSKAVLYTLGCRLNQAETALIANNLKNAGFEIAGEGEAVDLTVINTCTVTEQADSKCRQVVRQSIRKNPHTFVAVVGCYAQMAANQIAQIEGVDLIVGNEHKMRLADFLDHLGKRDKPTIIHTTKISREAFTVDSIGLSDTYTRANLKIQDGCSLVCSFCIIAKARGPARSRVFEDILAEARQLVNRGYKEIVLTGVNIGTYQYKDYRFLDVLQALDTIDGLERIRISSIEPTTVTREIIDFMAVSAKICAHLHIPLQSGDDGLLQSMRRKHTADDYCQIIEYAASTIKDIGIGTDIMVGYPGEGQEQFVRTKTLIADLPVTYFHVFSYSDRKGTGAYQMKPKVDARIKKERSRIMTEMGKRKKMAFYNQFLGQTMAVLFEEKHNGKWEGFTANYMRVRVPSAMDLTNQLRRVHLQSLDGQKIIGVLI